MKAMHRLGRLAAAACALPLFADAAAAQPEREAVRENLREIRTFLNPSRPLGERLRAGEAAEALTGADQETRAIVIFRNANADARLRAIALDKLENAVAADAALQRDVAEVLAERGAARVLRQQALEVIETLSFDRPAPSLAEGTARERLLALLDDPDPAFRLRAVTLLVNENDQSARARLAQGLRTPAAAAVPPADAVRLLGRSLAPDVLPLLRQVMASPPDEATRLEAIRALGRDAESREAMAALVRDGAAPRAVRLQALAALDANLSAEEFVAHALPVVGDESAGDSLRVYAIQSVKYRRGTAAGPAEDEFDAAVRAAASSASSAVVRQVAADYLRVRALAQP